MKVGIMTFQGSNNCGSMLQGYALTEKINTFEGVKGEVINFSNLEQQDMYALFRKVDSLKDFGLNIVTLLFYKKFKGHFNDYKSFLKKYIKLSNEFIYETEKLKEIVDNYDAFIAGSDQVWNIKCRDFDDAYYLSFVGENKKKIAYAPSFGSTNMAKLNINKYNNYIKSFDALSIRENNGAKWIKELTGRDAQVLLDPTFLLTKEEWFELAKDMDLNIKQEYIFYYAFNYSDEVNKIVKKFSKETGLPVIMMDAKSWVKKASKYGFKLSDKSGPLAFLNLMKNAKYVFTTSFHGTVFSILFEKKFWFIDSSMHNADDDRAETILRRLGLMDRMKKTNDMCNIKIDKDIDFRPVNKVLEIEREKSINYLKENLQ